MAQVITKRVIWGNINLDFQDWESDLRAEYPDYTERQLVEKMYEMNNQYLDDERINLNKELPNNIIAIASLGLWNGRFTGYKQIGTNISDCLNSECDYVEWYVDENEDFCFTGYHHDGTNYVKYRMVKEELDSDEIIEKIDERIFSNLPIDDLVEKYTSPIGNIISEIYGW